MPTAIRSEPQLVIAIDNSTVDEARALTCELGAAGVTWVKVGLELYTQAGPSLVSDLKRNGFHVFLDLKLYDIPNTVAKAVKAAAATGADLLTVHASGGAEMLLAAQDATRGTALSLLGVTVLTSFGGATFDEVCTAWGAQAGSSVSRGAVVLRLAEMANAAGLPGIVCSASDLRDGELQKISWCAPPLLVTPGIRNAADSRDDQKSIATVEQAVRLGSTHLVVGRPITAPAKGTRAQAAAEFLRQIKEAHGVSSHS
ncbi:MAG: orotidine-5'-phosphate decarboxylase [Deltaproteobacteria bacterium]|nr:orotidine-5'-phosphate decarboxylase [Deltaproteobacteria bacterium]